MPSWPPTALPDVLAAQRRACERAGSRLYGRLLDGIAADVASGGPCADVLRPHAADPFASALPLRFLAALHWLVLGGEAPELAAHYPSAGGTPGPRVVADLVATVGRHREAIESRIHLGVQTNEVGRSAALVGGFVEVARRTGLPLRVLEVGASAGLNSRWDAYWFDTGRSSLGDRDSPVRFVRVWEGERPVLDDVPVEVLERAACDRSPIDVTSDEGRRTARSYVWPDQRDRLARFDAAVAVAERVPLTVEHADLGEWLEGRLAEPIRGVATVVFHSIVWQYVAPTTRDRMRGALRRAGEEATPEAPVAWLRMEPAGPVADVRLTLWPQGGGEDRVLGTAEYQGSPVRWGAPTGRSGA